MGGGIRIGLDSVADRLDVGVSSPSGSSLNTLKAVNVLVLVAGCAYVIIGGG